MSETHIVGPPVTVRNPTRGVVRRQRCLWCGTLIDEIGARPGAGDPPADGTPPAEPGIWEPGAVIRVTGDNPQVTMIVDLGDDEPLPPDSCTRIDYEVTG